MPGSVNESLEICETISISKAVLFLMLEPSIIFDDVIIEPGARIRRAIIDKETIIGVGTTIGYDPEEDKRRGCTISDNGIVVVPKGMFIQKD